MSATPTLPEDRRTALIDFLFLDLSTCGRCLGTGANIEAALAVLDAPLRATDARVELRRIHVTDVEQARGLRFASSPTIRVNGRDIAPEVLESRCGACACGCGEDASCRAWRYRGREYTEAPVGLIVDAILSALYAGADTAPPPTPAFELPEKLRRTLEAGGVGAAEAGCCG